MTHDNFPGLTGFAQLVSRDPSNCTGLILIAMLAFPIAVAILATALGLMYLANLTMVFALTTLKDQLPTYVLDLWMILISDPSRKQVIGMIILLTFVKLWHKMMIHG
jgi:hypothetical protein